MAGCVCVEVAAPPLVATADDVLMHGSAFAHFDSRGLFAKEWGLGGGAILGKIVLGFAALISPSLNCNPQSLGNHSGQVPIPQSTSYAYTPHPSRMQTPLPLHWDTMLAGVCWGIFAFRMRLADFGKLKFEPEWF